MPLSEELRARLAKRGLLEGGRNPPKEGIYVNYTRQASVIKREE